MEKLAHRFGQARAYRWLSSSRLAFLLQFSLEILYGSL